MDGILNILKPPGMTSHDVVDFVRRLANLRRVGHAGTLDPGAAGVLVICLGRGTKLARFLHLLDKTYRAEMIFGYRTTTHDVFGEIVGNHDASGLSEARVMEVLPRFLGTVSQVPPMVSALKHEGRRLYDLARAGIEVPRSPRQVTIHDIRLVTSGGWGSPHPYLVMDIRCSTGTYIRTLCADIGDTLGCGACLSFLLRTRVGHFALEDAYTLEELCRLVTGGKLEEALTAPDRALQHLPGTEVQPQAAAGVLHGRRLTERDLSGPLPVQPGQLVRLRYRDTLLAVAEVGASPNDGIVIAPIWVNKT